MAKRRVFLDLWKQGQLSQLFIDRIGEVEERGVKLQVKDLRTETKAFKTFLFLSWLAALTSVAAFLWTFWTFSSNKGESPLALIAASVVAFVVVIALSILNSRFRNTLDAIEIVENCASHLVETNGATLEQIGQMNVRDLRILAENVLRKQADALPSKEAGRAHSAVMAKFFQVYCSLECLGLAPPITEYVDIEDLCPPIG